MTAFMEIKSKLERGLYIDNLNEMISECIQLARTANEPLVFYVLASIFSDIVRDWDQRPLQMAEVQEMEQRIGSPLENVFMSICDNRETQQLWEDLNALLRAFLR